MRQTTNLVLNALNLVVQALRQSHSVIQSDLETQFTSWAFTKRGTDTGLVGSVGNIGDGQDNAMIESF